MRAKVTTQFEGLPLVVVGRLNAKRTMITDSKGMTLKIEDGDKVEILESKKRAQNSSSIPCPFDLHKWFTVSKQI